VGTVLYAVDQLPTFVHILGCDKGEHYCRAAPAEAIGAVRTLARGLGIAPDKVAESNLGDMAARLKFLVPIFAAEGAPDNP